ncbi:hypothetical protein B0T24DRAFT_631561 [Lasiosphaeria ovina]|uniref:Membrane-associated protein n=1 Tax=Lasiosphaeria ovina TaxID=92902 RepID=A0AAE0K2V1_9PEZI|nr:hypothetical protein B0T24DRAFT_631561 [Lasiosphaeria ovina]
MLVFILSCIIALLSAAVIGLAAGTGIESQRANDAASKISALSSSLALATATRTGTGTGTGTRTGTGTGTGTPTASSTTKPSGASETPLPPGLIDDGCADNPESVNGSKYTSFSCKTTILWRRDFFSPEEYLGMRFNTDIGYGLIVFGGLTFQRFCNMDTPHQPLLSLFTADFQACMDSCASYTKYSPTFFGNNVNTTCAAVSFVPAWSSKLDASSAGSPGNCYLKPGPQNESALVVPSIGVACHAAVLMNAS